MTILRRLRREEGELGLVSALLLVAGVLLPLMFVVVVFARIEQGRLAAAQAARDAVRAAVEAPTATAAQQAADAALARAQTQTSAPLRLQLEGSFARGALLQAQTSAQISLASLPFVGSIGTVTVHGSAAAPVDTFRSLTTTP
ncbi:MAG: hypothetical protein KGJ43_01280 [Acidobacteriota bacterium]|nr:hypothetical protein [Acidobacteriota bacterium]